MKEAGRRYRRTRKLNRERVTALYHSLYFPPAIIFVAIMVAAIFGWQAAKLSLDNDLSTAAETHVAGMERSIHERLDTHEQVLRGGVGLLQSSDVIEAKDWSNYLDAFGVREEYAGVQGIGFIKIVTNDELPGLKESLEEQGVTGFHPWPGAPDKQIYAPVVYFQPTTPGTVSPIGYDMDSHPAKQKVMLGARDSGLIKMTPQIELMSAKPGTPRLGFNMYAPYYETNASWRTTEERAANIRGYVYAAFSSHTFFDALLRSTNSKAMGFSISLTSVGEERQLLYESPTFASINRKPDAMSSSRTIELYGQTWTVDLALDSHALISEIQLRGPESVLFFGTFSAMLISTVVLLLLRARSRDLIAQKEQAVELAKDELLSLASHQLRTPATGVKQYIGMVLQGFAGKVPRSQRDLLKKAYASNDRQLRIINEILHMAKIDAGRMVLAKQPTNLGSLVADIVGEQRADIDAAKHKLKLAIPAKAIIVPADMHVLRMAIENILSNAIKYTPRGGTITVRVRTYRNWAHVIVQDTGVGINPADIGKIFHQFSRLPNEMSQHVGGTGIGLYLARHLVELHGGSIEVLSKPSKGSTFTVTLPMPQKRATKQSHQNKKR